MFLTTLMINNFNRKKPGSPSTKLERDLKDKVKSQPDIVHDLKHKDDQMHLQTIEEFENEESLQEFEMTYEIDMGCQMDPDLFKRFDS